MTEPLQDDPIAAEPDSLGRATGRTMVWGQISKTLEGVLAIATAVAAIRALNPNAFGLYSLLTYLAGSASVFVPILVVEAAGAVLPRFREARERLSVAVMIAALRLGVIGVAVLVILPGWTFVRDVFGLDAISYRVFVVGAAYWIIQDVLNSVAAYFAIELELRPVALWKPIGQLVSLVGIVLVASTEDRWSSSVGEVLVVVTLGSLVTLCGLAFSARRYGRPGLPSREAAVSVLSFTRHTWVIGILTLALSTHADVLLIGAITNDPKQVAYYVAAFGVIVRAQLFLLSGWAAPMVPALSRAHLHGGFVSFARVWEIFADLWLFVSIPIMTLVAVLAHPLVENVFGTDYEPAGGLLAWAAAFSLGYGLIGGPLGTNALWVLDRQYLLTRIKAVAAVLSIGAAIPLIQRHGALGALLATGTALITTAFAEIFFAVRHGHVRYPYAFAARVVVASAASTVPTFVVRPGNLVETLACGFAGVAIYLVVCAILRPFGPADLDVLARASPRLGASPLRIFARA